MPKRTQQKTQHHIKPLPDSCFTMVVSVPKNKNGEDLYHVGELHKWVKQYLETKIALVLKTRPMILDHIKDPKTGLFVKYRFPKLQVTSLNTSNHLSVGIIGPSVVMCQLTMIVSNQSHKTTNHGRRYASLIKESDKLLSSELYNHYTPLRVSSNTD